MDFAWQTAGEAGFSDEALEAVKSRLDAGERPTPRALVHWAYARLGHDRPDMPDEHRGLPRFIWYVWFPGPAVREVLEILGPPRALATHGGGTIETVVFDQKRRRGQTKKLRGRPASDD